LTRDEVKALLAGLQGVERLFLALLYGTGMRLFEGLRLRVKDMDFSVDQITIPQGKGGKDRVTMLPTSLKQDLREHLKAVKQLHEQDLQKGFGEVELPYALARKYPRAGREWGWQFVFPGSERSRDPRSGALRRHHLHERRLQRAFHDAVRSAGITKHARPFLGNEVFDSRRRRRRSRT
jgi:integrase